MTVVFAPATTGNLGPGFDVLGAALDFGLTVRANPSDELHIKSAPDTPTGEDNLLWKAVQRTAPGAPPMAIEIVSDIPLGRGLGSSAAVIAAGLRLGVSIAKSSPSDDEMLELGLDLEGHPDNLMPAIGGGLWLCGPKKRTKVAITADIRPYFLIPREPVATKDAREVLGVDVTRSDAVSNMARTATLVAILAGVAEGDLLDATEDLLHQSQRAPLMGATTAVIAELRANGVAACVSGAGPSVLCLVEPSSEATFDRLTQGVEGFEIRRSAWSNRGASII